MRRELLFLNESIYSYGFRTKKGYDEEIILSKEALKEIPHIPGIYIIVAEDKTQFIYPKGKNSVIYIGKAEDLHKRLGSHIRKLNELVEKEEEWLCDHKETQPRYQYIKAFGGRVYTFHCLGKQNAKELEASILWRFYEKYGALPVGNGARSFSAE